MFVFLFLSSLFIFSIIVIIKVVFLYRKNNFIYKRGIPIPHLLKCFWRRLGRANDYLFVFLRFLLQINYISFGCILHFIEIISCAVLLFTFFYGLLFNLLRLCTGLGSIHSETTPLPYLSSSDTIQ